MVYIGYYEGMLTYRNQKTERIGSFFLQNYLLEKEEYLHYQPNMPCNLVRCALSSRNQSFERFFWRGLGADALLQI
jgi:hypothetical protein